MLRTILFMGLISLLSALVCVELEPSFLASASDCSVAKVDENTLRWGAVITFKADVSHRENNWFNLLADTEHPRLPYFPVGSICTSNYGLYYEGQSATINCTQGFDDIPRDYVNAVYVLEDSTSPYGFSMKVPLGLFHEAKKEGNLSIE